MEANDCLPFWCLHVAYFVTSHLIHQISMSNRNGFIEVYKNVKCRDMNKVISQYTKHIFVFLSSLLA